MDGSKQWSAAIVESTFMVDFENQLYSDSLRFQKFPLCGAFTKDCGYRSRFPCIREDVKRKSKKCLRIINESGYLWTGPKRS